MGPWTPWLAGLDRPWVSSRFNGRLWIKMEGREREPLRKMLTFGLHMNTHTGEWGRLEKKMARC